MADALKWWQYATPQKVQAIDALEFARSAGSGLFRALYTPGPDSVGDVMQSAVQRRMDNPTDGTMPEGPAYTPDPNLFPDTAPSRSDTQPLQPIPDEAPLKPIPDVALSSTDELAQGRAALDAARSGQSLGSAPTDPGTDFDPRAALKRVFPNGWGDASGVDLRTPQQTALFERYQRGEQLSDADRRALYDDPLFKLPRQAAESYLPVPAGGIESILPAIAGIAVPAIAQHVLPKDLPGRGAIIAASGLLSALGANRIPGAAGALDEFLGQAPEGYVDPSRRGALSATTAPGVGPGEGEGIVPVKPSDITFRPDLFQARDVTPGLPYDQQRVAALAQNYDPALVDPVKLIRDTSTGDLVVAGGHHRVGAAQQAGAETIPARITTLDLSDPQQVAKAQGIAALDNFLTRQQNVREQYNGLKAVIASGTSQEELPDLTGIGSSRIQQVLDIGDAGPQVLERAVTDKQLEPIAAAVGAAKRTWGFNDEMAGAWFNDSVAQGKGRSLPSASAVKDTLDTYYRLASEAGVQQGALFGEGTLAGMGQDPVRALAVERMKTQTALERDLNNVTVEQRRLRSTIARFPDDPGAADAGRTLVEKLQSEADRLRERVQAMDAAAADEIRAKFAPTQQPPLQPQSLQLDPASQAGLDAEIARQRATPTQGGMLGTPDQPTFRPENTPDEQQAGLPMGGGTQPVESAGPLFAGSEGAGGNTPAEPPAPPERTSATAIETALGVTHERAQGVLDTLERQGIVGAADEHGVRPVLDGKRYIETIPADNPSNVSQPAMGDLRAPVPPQSGYVPPRESPSDVSQPPLGDLHAPQPPESRTLPPEPKYDTPPQIAMRVDDLIARGEALPPRPPDAHVLEGIGPDNPSNVSQPKLVPGEPAKQGMEFTFPAEPDPPPGTGSARMIPEAPPEPPGRRPPRPTDMRGKTPKPDPKALRAKEAQALGLLNEIVPGRDVSNELLRRYEGAMGEAGLELRQQLDDSNQLLKGHGIGKQVGNNRVVTRDPRMESLYRALHGEGDVPANLQDVYDEAQRWVQWEQAATLDFDPKAATVEDYFNRGWRVVEADKARSTPTSPTGSGSVGATPKSSLPRVDATFSELLDNTYTRADGSQFTLEPISWNPFEQSSFRRVMGVRYRAQMTLLANMKVLDQAVPIRFDGEIPQGYRVPQVGPAFEGKRIAADTADGPPGVMTVARYAVPENVANVLENIYGKPKLTGPVMETISKLSNVSKQAKLFGSLFQQLDFATRTGFSTFGAAVDDVLHGEPIGGARKIVSFPKAVVDMVAANLSSDRRAALRTQMLSDDSFIAGRNISYRGLLDQGWKTTDVSLQARDIMATLDDVMQDASRSEPANVLQDARRKLGNINGAVQNGLFDGVYPVAQMTALKNFVVPRMLRAHPEWSDTQIMAESARETNVMFSSLGEFQTVFRNDRTARDLSRVLLFSTNESESLLRQAASATGITDRGNANLWRQYYLGGALFLGTVANVVHFAATGQPLPFERYSPLNFTHDQDGKVTGVQYNSQFMAPNVPIVQGRGDLPLTAQLIGQMDTVFRALDPVSFVAARLNTLPRAGWNQAKGSDFYGRPINQSGPFGLVSRAEQLASDLALPIGAGNLVGVGGGGVETQPRLGTGGRALQAGGVRLNAMQTPDLLNYVAGGGRQWKDLTPRQQQLQLEANPTLKAELDRRTQEGADRGAVSSEARLAREAVDQRRVASETTLAQRAQSGQDSPQQFKDGIESLQDAAANQKAQSYRDFKLYQDTYDPRTGQGKLPADPNQRALVEYFGTWQRAETAPGSGQYDHQLRDQLEADLFSRLTPTQKTYVQDRAATAHAPAAQWYFDNKALIRDSGYYARSDDAFDRVKQFIDQQGGYPVHLPASYTDLVVDARQAAGQHDTSTANALEGVIARVDRLSVIEKDKLRRENPGLDRALVENYGLTPITQQGRTSSSQNPLRSPLESGALSTPLSGNSLTSPLGR